MVYRTTNLMNYLMKLIRSIFGAKRRDLTNQQHLWVGEPIWVAKARLAWYFKESQKELKNFLSWRTLALSGVTAPCAAQLAVCYEN